MDTVGWSIDYSCFVCFYNNSANGRVCVVMSIRGSGRVWNVYISFLSAYGNLYECTFHIQGRRIFIDGSSEGLSYGTVNSKLSYCNLHACVTIINTSMFFLPAITLIIETWT